MGIEHLTGVLCISTGDHVRPPDQRNMRRSAQCRVNGSLGPFGSWRRSMNDKVDLYAISTVAGPTNGNAQGALENRRASVGKPHFRALLGCFGDMNQAHLVRLLDAVQFERLSSRGPIAQWRTTDSESFLTTKRMVKDFESNAWRGFSRLPA